MRSMTPGRKPSSRASARSTSVSRAATPSGCFRSRARLRRPRCRTSHPGASGAGPRTACARSTRMTSAPMSDSIIAANGPGPIPASSMTRMPVSGPATGAARSGHAGHRGRRGARRLDRRREPEDRPGHEGPQRVGQVVAHAGHMRRLAPGTSSAVRSPPLGVMSVSSRPWMTSVGAVDACGSASPRGPMRRSRPAGGARPRGRTAVEGLGGALLGQGEVEVAPSSRRPRCPRPRRDGVGAVGRRRRHQDGHGLRRRAPYSGSPVIDMIEVSEAHPGRVLDGHGLGDHPAHRRAHDVGRGRCRGGRAGRRRRRPCRDSVYGTAGSGSPGERGASRRRGRRSPPSSSWTGRSRGCRSG